MKEKVKKNFEALNKLMYPLFFEIGEHSFKVTGKKPVRIKASIEKLIAEGKMDQGSIWQHRHYVEYSPDGLKRRIDVR